MTDRTKFEAMLEALINEDHESAKDIFHNIVVAKSREIYEQLLAEEFESDEDEPAFGDDEDEDDFGDDDTETDDEVDSDDIDDEEGEDDDMFGGDDDSFGDEDENGDIEDRVMDLEDALDELKSEFEQLLAGEEDEPEHDDMFGGEEEEDMFGDEGEEAPMFGKEENEFQSMFEYVNKVALPVRGNDGDNTQSLFNKPKYNDMGGVAPKFGGTATGEGTAGGLLKPTTTKMDAGNKNVPGNSKAPKLTPVAKGHGAEKKGTSDQAPNKRSIVAGRK